jgi:hypothetical protein
MVVGAVLHREGERCRGMEMMRPWLRVTPGGHIQSRVGEERREGPWRNNATTSNPSASSKGRDEERDGGGYKAMVNGGATSGMT